MRAAIAFTTCLGEFIWMDGSSAAFFSWNDGEPNNGANGDENCVEMVMYGNSKWNDVSCANTYGYICKKYQGRGNTKRTG